MSDVLGDVSGVVVSGGDGGEEDFFYGSVRFRGVGNFSLTTATIPLLAG